MRVNCPVTGTVVREGVWSLRQGRGDVRLLPPVAPGPFCANVLRYLQKGRKGERRREGRKEKRGERGGEEERRERSEETEKREERRDRGRGEGERRVEETEEREKRE